MSFSVSNSPDVHGARKTERTYKVHAGLTFSTETPENLMRLLVHLHNSQKRVLLTYGNLNTGKLWESATPERGRLGRSTGRRKVLLLVRTARSLGGEALVDDCILQVRESKGGKVLWTHPILTDTYEVVDKQYLGRLDPSAEGIVFRGLMSKCVDYISGNPRYYTKKV